MARFNELFAASTGNADYLHFQSWLNIFVGSPPHYVFSITAIDSSTHTWHWGSSLYKVKTRYMHAILNKLKKQMKKQNTITTCWPESKSKVTKSWKASVQCNAQQYKTNREANWSYNDQLVFFRAVSANLWAGELCRARDLR